MVDASGDEQQRCTAGVGEVDLQRRLLTEVRARSFEQHVSAAGTQ